MIKVAPSLLSADYARLGEAAAWLDTVGADWVHLDCMDGVFVPNISFGQIMVKALRPLTDLFFDVHLMIQDPAAYIEEFAGAGADMITVHAENAIHLQRTLQRIRRAGKKAGVALNPATPPEAVEYVLEDVDMVLCMSVNPGYGGQDFIPQVLRKVEAVANRVARLGRPVEIEVDGGITPDNAPALIAAGATVLVAGNAVFNAADPALAIRRLRGET